MANILNTVEEPEKVQKVTAPVEFVSDELDNNEPTVTTQPQAEVKAFNPDKQVEQPKTAVQQNTATEQPKEKKSLGAWVKTFWQDTFGNRPVQTDADREYNARQKQKIGQWGRLLMALGNAYAVGHGAYSATIPDDNTEKTIDDWKKTLREQQYKQATLDEQKRQYDTTLAERTKEAQDKLEESKRTNRVMEELRKEAIKANIDNNIRNNETSKQNNKANNETKLKKGGGSGSSGGKTKVQTKAQSEEDRVIAEALKYGIPTTYKTMDAYGTDVIKKIDTGTLKRQIAERKAALEKKKAKK